MSKEQVNGFCHKEEKTRVTESAKLAASLLAVFFEIHGGTGELDFGGLEFREMAPTVGQAEY